MPKHLVGNDHRRCAFIKSIPIGCKEMSLGSSSESSLEKLEEKVRKSDGGVVYVGHLPHGFYEDQIKKYCSQFGTVLGVKVSRSKKTGRSKGFGFIEFENEEVAKIVADSMNNYLMFDKLLKCKLQVISEGVADWVHVSLQVNILSQTESMGECWPVGNSSRRTSAEASGYIQHRNHTMR